MAARVKWLRPALKDLQRIIEYIAVESPVNANKISLDLFARTDKLKSFPRQGSKFGRFQSAREVRQVHVYSWRILYEIYENEVRILRVVHMAQDVDKLKL